MEEKSIVLNTRERPPLSKWIPLSFQHVFAMFGATVLVPILTGLSISAALFTAGTGTLIYIIVTGARVPAFLGSSFAFIPALIGIGSTYGIPYAMGGAVAAGLFYLVIAGSIKPLTDGPPSVVIGSVIIVIGLNLAPTAMGMAMNDAAGNYSLIALSIAVVTLAVTVIANIFLAGFFSTIPILIGLVCGYLFTLIMGFITPAYALIDFTVVREAAWFGLPQVPGNLVAIITFIIVSLATVNT